jgi:hypothetical protein
MLQNKQAKGEEGRKGDRPSYMGQKKGQQVGTGMRRGRRGARCDLEVSHSKNESKSSAQNHTG